MALHNIILTRNREEFLQALAHAIHEASGGREDEAQLTLEEAHSVAEEVWQRLKTIGEDAYPCLLRHLGMQFIYQWDERPRLLTVMIWVEKMWQDIRRIVVPRDA